MNRRTNHLGLSRPDIDLRSTAVAAGPNPVTCLVGLASKCALVTGSFSGDGTQGCTGLQKAAKGSVIFLILRVTVHPAVCHRIHAAIVTRRPQKPAGADQDHDS